MLNARDKVEEAFMLFSKKLEGGTGFFEPIRKLKLKTFADLQKSTIVKDDGKDIIMKADKRVFGQMVLIAENRKLAMKDPRGPNPGSLANGEGTLKKTDQANLGKQ